jgi:hypothetical protein
MAQDRPDSINNLEARAGNRPKSPARKFFNSKQNTSTAPLLQRRSQCELHAVPLPGPRPGVAIMDGKFELHFKKHDESKVKSASRCIAI